MRSLGSRPDDERNDGYVSLKLVQGKFVSTLSAEKVAEHCMQIEISN